MRKKTVNMRIPVSFRNKCKAESALMGSKSMSEYLERLAEQDEPIKDKIFGRKKKKNVFTI